MSIRMTSRRFWLVAVGLSMIGAVGYRGAKSFDMGWGTTTSRAYVLQTTRQYFGWPIHCAGIHVYRWCWRTTSLHSDIGLVDKHDYCDELAREHEALIFCALDKNTFYHSTLSAELDHLRVNPDRAFHFLSLSRYTANVAIWLIVCAGVRRGISALRSARISRRIRAFRCAQCGYSVIGNVSGLCPECGTPVPSQHSDPKGP